MSIKETDITYVWDHGGYMLYYKRKALGGAGVAGVAKRTPGNLKHHQEQAENAKQETLAGRRHAEQVAKIDREMEGR